MTLLCIALCFVSSLVGGVLGMQVFFWIGKPHVHMTIAIQVANGTSKPAEKAE